MQYDHQLLIYRNGYCHHMNSCLTHHLLMIRSYFQYFRDNIYQESTESLQFRIGLKIWNISLMHLMEILEAEE